MKLKLLNCLLLSFFCFVPSILAQPSDWDLEGLSGRVKKIEEEIAEIKVKNGAAKETSRRLSRSFIFDKNGRLTYEWVRIGNLPPFEQRYSFEKNYTRRIRQTTRIDLFGASPKNPPPTYSLSVLRYEAGENAVYQDVYTGDGQTFDVLTQKYKYVFGKDNRLSEKILLSTKGETVLIDKYVYDGDSRLPTERVLSVPGSAQPQIIKYTYELDARGNWIKQTQEKTLATPQGKMTEVMYRKISYY